MSSRGQRSHSEFGPKPRWMTQRLSHAEQDWTWNCAVAQLALQRFHVLLLASLVVSGTARDAWALKSFLERTVHTPVRP